MLTVCLSLLPAVSLLPVVLCVVFFLIRLVGAQVTKAELCELCVAVRIEIGNSAYKAT